MADYRERDALWVQNYFADKDVRESQLEWEEVSKDIFPKEEWPIEGSCLIERFIQSFRSDPKNKGKQLPPTMISCRCPKCNRSSL